ncbi:MAG: response regulator, partial [Syntrophales bacterium LBB04]|nr:response regulator [Syntrophales bacterium LBB04]
MNREKIMVVEDEWVVADQLCRHLQDLGYTISSTASTGDEAIRKAEADSPDLILMDIVLKGKMDGIEAADRINSQFNIPMIYLTAYTNPEYIERAKQTKPFSYLVKPFNQKELHANIEMSLHRHLADKEIKEHLDRLKRG